MFKGVMKSRKIMRTIALLIVMIMCVAACSGCGSDEELNSDLSVSAEEEVSVDEVETEDDSEVVTLEWTVDDLTGLEDVISGISDMELDATATVTSLRDALVYDDSIVERVAVTSDVVFGTAGTYEAVYTITFDRAALISYMEENDIEIGVELNSASGSTVKVQIAVAVVVTGDVVDVDAEATEAVDGTDDAEGADDTDTSASNADSTTSTGSTATSSSGSTSSSSGSHTHNHDIHVVNQEPTCGTAGSETYTCSVCGYSKTYTLPATGNHTWVENTVEQDVYETREVTRCSVCNCDMSSWSQSEISEHSKAHMLAGEGGGYYSRGESVKVGTQTVGTGTYYCSVCGATK